MLMTYKSQQQQQKLNKSDYNVLLCCVCVCCCGEKKMILNLNSFSMFLGSKLGCSGPKQQTEEKRTLFMHHLFCAWSGTPAKFAIESYIFTENKIEAHVHEHMVTQIRNANNKIIALANQQVVGRMRVSSQPVKDQNHRSYTFQFRRQWSRKVHARSVVHSYI